jgi:membrane protein implicated in regulation of membrane protease activity
VESSIILWIIIGVATLVIDIVTGSFLFIWFTIGAIGAIAAKVLGGYFMAQVITFLAISGISMIIGYPIAKKNIKQSVKPTLTREKTYIGKEIVVSEELLCKRAVKLDGVYWNLINNGEILKEGDKIRVVGVQGNKIVIRKI